MGKLDYTNADTMLQRALRFFDDECRRVPESRFFPLVCDRLQDMRIHLRPLSKTTLVTDFCVYVTQVTAIDVLLNKDLLMWEEKTYLPFASFSNMVTAPSRELAWRTGGWVLTDERMTPTEASLTAALWLLDREAGLPMEIGHGGLVARF